MKKKQRNNWKIAFISIVVFLVLIFLLASLSQNETNNSNSQQTEQDNVGKLEKIVQDYHATHTYSKIDLFVCTDTSIDVWNLVKTKGINAEICVGNVESKFTGIDFFTQMNHAWVIAEAEPFTWLALETTGGYLVWGENNSNEEIVKNNLYYNGLCFTNPSEFKKFLGLRDDFFEVCNEAKELTNEWNNNYVGKILTTQDYEFKGKVEAKNAECEKVSYQLIGLLS